LTGGYSKLTCLVGVDLACFGDGGK
jgi:hypothetical protein